MAEMAIERYDPDVSPSGIYDRMAQFASYAEAEADCQARHRASVLALLEPTP